MAKLIVYGNPNQYTFANSIVAANLKSIDAFKEPLNEIFVIHSQTSHQTLKNLDDWVEHLRKNGISENLITPKIVNLDVNNSSASIDDFINFIQTAIKGYLEEEESESIIIDLSNGVGFQKNLLSIVAYLLGISHQYLIDIVELKKNIEDVPTDRFSPIKFVDGDILSRSYVAIPNLTDLDRLAYLGLMEVARYKKIIEMHTSRFESIDRSVADSEFFKKNLMHSVNFKLLSDKKSDRALYRISSAGLSANIEELLALITEKYNLRKSGTKDNSITLGTRLGWIYTFMKSQVEKARKVDIDKAKPVEYLDLSLYNEDPLREFDLEFFKAFNDFVLHLRNQSVHKKHPMSKIDKFKSDLSIKIFFSFIEFYTDIVYPILDKNQQCANQPKKISYIYDDNISEDEVFYYGLDGDKTGSSLENLFVNNCNESEFRKKSDNITKAIRKIAEKIQNSERGEIIFEAGDDLLFKGRFNRSSLAEMQKIYKDTTGLSCSIGYGSTLQETYVALKRAKVRSENKWKVVGLRIQ